VTRVSHRTIAGAPWRPRSFLALSLAALVFAPVAPAQDSPAEYLRLMDANGDGRIDLREFQEYMIVGFDARDRNGNGVLDLDEQPPGSQRRPVSRVAHLRALEAAFRRQDRSRDGYLDARELAAPPAH